MADVVVAVLALGATLLLSVFPIVWIMTRDVAESQEDDEL